MSSAERKRRQREREREGKIVIPVEIEEVDVAEALVAAGYLPKEDAYDRKKLAEALSRAVVRILPAE